MSISRKFDMKERVWYGESLVSEQSKPWKWRSGIYIRSSSHYACTK